VYEEFSPVEESVTPEFVLDVLVDIHRQQCQFDAETDSDAKLSSTTTVAEWRRICDLLPWRDLATGYNRWFGINCTLEAWQEVLMPEKRKTLADVCRLIASHAKFPKARPAMVLGCPCLSAGAFLTIRALLSKAGANVAQLAPSTLLGAYSRRYFETFIGPISWLEPGSVPAVKIHHPIYHSSVFGILLGMLAILVGGCASLPWFTIIGCVVLVSSYMMTWVAARCLGPSRVEFGQLKTFRELATVISRQAPGS
jgi:hypothetical protein